MKIKQELTREFFVRMGKKSGKINKAKGKAYFSRMGKLGAKKRWGAKKIKK